MKPRLRTALGVLVLLFAVGMMAYGVWRGEPDTVLGKAITICLQCIGIG